MYDDVNRIREIVSKMIEVKEERVIVACTHNHEGPDTIGLWSPDEFTSGINEEYMTFLIESASECIEKAYEPRRTVKCKVGSTKVLGVAKNTSDKDIIDPELIAINFNDGNNTVATIVNYANHPEALGSKTP